MRSFLATLAVLAVICTGCMRTEPMTAEELQKYPRPSSESFQHPDPKDVRQPKPETCLEAGKMYESLALGTNIIQQKRDFAWRAKQAYQQALRLRPGWAAASMGLARVEEQEGNLQQATAYAHQALQQVTGRDILEAGTCHEVGLFFARLKQFDASLAAMHKAVQIDPSNRTYAMNYGFTLARSGRMEDSYQYFCKIMNPAEAAYQVALMARHVGDTQRARQYASLVLQQNPSHKEATELLTKLEQATSTDVQQVQQLESATAPAQ